MRIGVTNLFKGSAFGGALPQVALFMATAFKAAGHDVTFLIPIESDDWFIDCSGCKDIPSVKLAEGLRLEIFDLVVEIVWFLPFSLRAQIAKKVVMFYHYSPVFYDIESSTYPLATLVRDFTGVAAVWTWAHFKPTDYSYLEFVSRLPVFKCPFFWNPMLLDAFIAETAVPEWTLGTATATASALPKVVICESNQTNTSNCTLPLVIVSEIYKNNKDLKWTVLNSEDLCKREFFINNVIKNLHFGSDLDISGNFLKRVRLPDLRREPNVIISHQRFRPLKYMLLDALYLGIPLIHNCELLKMAGGYYELNRIGQALKQWQILIGSKGPDKKQFVLTNWGPAVGLAAVPSLISDTFSYVPPVIPVRPSVRIAFFDMWVDFQPSCNLFLEAFKQNGHVVCNDQLDPTVIIFGPFGNENANVKWGSVPKVFYTGENLPPVLRSDVVLNVGFQRGTSSSYKRLPNWFLELNWYNQDAALIKNPMPFSLDLLTEPVTIRSKFCIFVTSNPNCVERNTLFHAVSRYKKVDSCGLLFNNCTQIPSGPGGSGGQVDKVKAYGSYKFALVCENSSTPGYVTEKLLHAKLAGCVPIYWGAPDVALDFNKEAFINASSYDSAAALLEYIEQVDNDAGLWLKLATAPLLKEEHLDLCRSVLSDFCTGVMGLKALVPVIESKIIGAKAEVVEAGAGAAAAASGDRPKIPSYPISPIKNTAPQVIVTCCNSKFVASAVQLIKSSPVPVYVWVWDVEFMDVKKLTKAGAAMVLPLDTKWNPAWADFWNTAHYAWKPLVMVLANSCLEAGSHVLYLDSGIEIIDDLEAIWTNISRDGFFVCKMPEHKMRTWCHPKFCSVLSLTETELDSAQISANIVGFISGFEKATNLLSQVLGLACNPEVIVGHKWHPYSSVCKGHRHDQSILSLICIRAGINMHLLDNFAGWKSKEETLKYGGVLYVHRGSSSAIASAAPVKEIGIKNIADCFVVNLAHRKDRLEQFWQNQPYLMGLCKRLEAINGRELILTRDVCNLFKNNDFAWKKSVMGCALSHFGLWKHISSLDSGSFLVLEDDAVLVGDFMNKWSSCASMMPLDSDIVFLGGVLPPNKAGLPLVTEPLNSMFAKVAVNAMFGSKRRYFHFCTYSYIITVAGAQKLCSLVAERGLYTSADHMLVNNMDLLNVYFTTPLLAGCIQDNDPIYQNADFNNFNRVDKFDSEIWNNTDCFTAAEVLDVSSTTLEDLTVVYFEPEQQKQCIDSQWLREIFQREFVWTSFTDSVKTGSKVLLYYQHTTSPSIIEGWINRNIDCAIYLLHASDESCKADVSLYNHPAVRSVFRNYWRPDCISDKVLTLPLGYLNGKGGSGKVLVSSQRPVVWSFAGAIDRAGRAEALDLLKGRYSNYKVHLTPTWGTDKNLEAASYLAMLQECKFVPCLDGFFNTESYRFYEALESGALPIVRVDEKRSYENLLTDAPLLTVNSWSDDIVYDWDSKQKNLLFWWCNYKALLSKKVADYLAK